MWSGIGQTITPEHTQFLLVILAMEYAAVHRSGQVLWGRNYLLIMALKLSYITSRRFPFGDKLGRALLRLKCE